MNITNLDYVASWLEAGAPERGRVEHFNMGVGLGRLTPACGSVCCIAGASVEFFNKPVADRWIDSVMNWPAIRDEAERQLGLPRDISHELFHADGLGSSLDENRQIRENIPPQWAARCIRKLMATGKVDWLGTMDVPEQETAHA